MTIKEYQPNSVELRGPCSAVQHFKLNDKWFEREIYNSNGVPLSGEQMAQFKLSTQRIIAQARKEILRSLLFR